MTDFDAEAELARAADAAGAAHASLWRPDAALRALRCTLAPALDAALEGCYALTPDALGAEAAKHLGTEALDWRVVAVPDDTPDAAGQLLLGFRGRAPGDGVASVRAFAERYAHACATRRNENHARRGRLGPAVLAALAVGEPGALDALRALLEAETATVFRVEPGTGMLRCTDAAGPVARSMVGAALAPGEGIVGDVVMRRATARVSDTSVDPRFLRDVDHALPVRTRSVACAPLPRRDGAAAGALHVGNKLAPRGVLPAFDADDEAWLSLAASALAAGPR